MNISNSFVPWRLWVRFLRKNSPNFSLIFDPAPLAVSGRQISWRFFMSIYLFLIPKTDRLLTRPKSLFTTPVLSSASFNAPGGKEYNSLTLSQIAGCVTPFQLPFGPGLRNHSDRYARRD